ncbi:MIP/aquaporin family protein [Thermomicrobium sp.]|uniref:MIP/aquaporin family protein n=1 Tax=Thermomicrobium sp. TaxID=1969469 RepID=UPI001B090741|nr:MIP/aquaporin family protein [Thermomicrobium sp.]MBO9307082.1 aquaporin family protein [Thermomicrobium sp.]
MEKFLAELIGTLILVLLGDGVVAAVLLARSKAQNSGWIVITTGWAFAVAVAVYATGRISGAHINPAVTIGLAVGGDFPWGDVPLYIIAQFIGAFLGAVLVWLAYLPHWGVTEDPGLKLAVFSTGPAIRNYPLNLITEIIGTFMLVFGVRAILANELVAGLAPLLVGVLVWGIGLSLGGPTGYAINPARDLGPRIAHALLPIPGKGGSDWQYAWVPVVGPIIGGIAGSLLFNLLLQ